MKEYTHLVWDFNGTILNDVEEDLLCANELLANHGLPVLRDVEAYREVFGFPIIEYYRRLGFDFEKTPYEELAVEWVEIYHRHGAHAGLYPQVRPTLERVARLGLPQIILSATHLDMLKGQVEALGIRSYFSELLGLDNIHAHSKTALALAWRERNPQAVPLFLGDTEHDFDTAQAMGADCVLVAGGHRPRAALERVGAVSVISSVDEIFSILLN
jgi:phosphoglycolate phosphatase